MIWLDAISETLRKLLPNKMVAAGASPFKAAGITRPVTLQIIQLLSNALAAVPPEF